MKRKILTKIQLKKIEQEIDKIIELTDQLSPNNPHDAEILSYEDIKLDKYISILERSYKNARIEESGFKLVN